MRLQRKKVQVEEETLEPQGIRKETPTPSEEELSQEHFPESKQPQPPEQKLVKRPPNEQAKSPLAETPPARPARPSPLLSPKKGKIPTPQVQNGIRKMKTEASWKDRESINWLA